MVILNILVAARLAVGVLLISVCIRRSIQGGRHHRVRGGVFEENFSHSRIRSVTAQRYTRVCLLNGLCGITRLCYTVTLVFLNKIIFSTS